MWFENWYFKRWFDREKMYGKITDFYKQSHVLENQETDISNIVVWKKYREKVRENVFITSCTRKPRNWYFKHCGLKYYGKKVRKNISRTSCTRSASNWYFKRCGLKKYRKKVRENVCITSCTRKGSNWYFKSCGLKKYGTKNANMF